MKKVRPKTKPRPEILICILLIILHFSCGLCRHHMTSSHDRIRNSLNNGLRSLSQLEDLTKTATIMNEQINHDRSDSQKPDFVVGTHSKSPTSGASDITLKSDAYREASSPDDGSESDLNGNYDATTLKNFLDTSEDGVLPSSSSVFDVTLDVSDGGENNGTSLLTGYDQELEESQVWSLVDEIIAKRYQNRTRRQRSVTDTPRHKRKRRHRLLLKSRAANNKNNHMSPVEGRKGKKARRNFILKSDSEGHIITSASKVKKDWCHTVAFNHTVAAPRCVTKTVNNNFCYGQCNSFFIPQQRTSEGVAFQSYSNCKPDRLRWANVTLDCPNQNPPTVQKTVLVVDSCRCIATDEPNDQELYRKIRHHTRGSRRKSRLMKNHKNHR